MSSAADPAGAGGRRPRRTVDFRSGTSRGLAALLLLPTLAACGPREGERAPGTDPPADAGRPAADAPDAPGDAGPALTSARRAALRQVELPDGMSLELVAAGAEVFHGKGSCHVCHGPEGTGARGVGADLTDLEWWHSDGSWEAIIAQVRRGVPQEEARNEWGAIMPPRGGSPIDDQEVRAVAAYVWTLRHLPPQPEERGVGSRRGEGRAASPSRHRGGRWPTAPPAPAARPLPVP